MGKGKEGNGGRALIGAFSGLFFGLACGFVGGCAAVLSYDAEHGGLVYGFGPDQQWCDSEKYFWVQGESLATCAQLYKATADAKCVERFRGRG